MIGRYSLVFGLTKMFDEEFDHGEDIVDYLDFSKAFKVKDVKLRTNTKEVNVDFPELGVESLDREAKKNGVMRQPIIKMWIAERLTEEATH